MGAFTSPPKNFITPPKQSLGKLLRRIAVLRSEKKFKEVKELARSLKSDHTVSEIAGYTGETTQAVYRLLSCGKNQRSKKEYVKKLTCLDKEEVIRIYNDDEVTYSLPDMKYAGLRFMHFTIREAYGVYLKKCKLKRIVAEKTFEALKPKFVRTVQETLLCGVRCEYFANFAKTREALIAVGMKGIQRNHAEAIEATWCPFKKEHDGITSHTSRKVLHALARRECVRSECEKCGVTKYEQQLILQNCLTMRQVNQVKWKQLGPVKGKDKHGNKTRRIEQLSKSGSVVNLLKLYTQQLKKMSLHQFFKLWQLRNFNMVLENIQPGQVMFVHDFQQNLLLLTQDEALASHWDDPQLTIHPTCVFYHCPTCPKLVKEDIIHISMDKSHDKNGVNQFISTTIQHLKDKGITITEIIEFTDHSTLQYKSKFTFHNMTKLDIPCTRHYFGVKHRKGPSDRAGGNFKRTIRCTVKAGHVLLNADEIEKYCEEQFNHQITCENQNTERDVNGEHDCDSHHLSEHDVHRKRDGHSLFKVYNHKVIQKPKNMKDLNTLEGTRDHVHIVPNTGIKGLIEY